MSVFQHVLLYRSVRCLSICLPHLHAVKETKDRTEAQQRGALHSVQGKLRVCHGSSLQSLLFLQCRQAGLTERCALPGHILVWFKKRIRRPDYTALRAVPRTVKGSDNKQRPRTQVVRKLERYQEDFGHAC